VSESFATRRLDTPIGPLAVAVTERGVAAISFDEPGFRLADSLPRGAALVEDAAATRAVADELAAYFAGEISRFATPADLRGTDFQESVWRALLAIPYGGTVSYGELARGLGKPGAARAVGLANNRNRIGILVPCHRVVGSDGALVGYAGGLERKRWLIAHERRVANARTKGDR
jgi:O-6-methylguanine DNA methyltransferase